MKISFRKFALIFIATLTLGTAARAQERKRESGSRDEITTDRPDFTEASSTVGKGRQQIESGYTFSRNRDAGILSSHAYPELLLRVGVISDALELRVGQSFIRSTAASVDGDEVVSTGAEDLYLGVKLALSSQRQTWPEVALVAQSTVPTGTHGLTAGRMLPGANLLYGWELGSGAFSLGGSSQVNGALNDDRHTYAEFAQAVTVGWDFVKRVGAYVEAYAFVPLGNAGASVERTRYLNGGFRFRPNRSVQLDVRVGRGLTAASDDYFVGAGFSVRH